MCGAHYNQHMKLHFKKMQGAGNDFVVIDCIGQRVTLDEATVRRIADRHFGVGADQLLLVERPTVPDVDFRYRIFNADGGEVEHCGNGARCFVKFVREAGLTDKQTVRVQVRKGVATLTMREDGEVTVDMGEPVLEPARVPFDTSALAGRIDGDATVWPLNVRGKTVWISVVSMGNPHAVQVVDDVAAWPVSEQGAAIESHPRFPARVNAGFMQVVDRHTVRLRVFERGAGETLACGTGACAAVVAGVGRRLLDSPVVVETRGGRLTIAWDGSRVMMTGPAQTVFEGVIDI
jgi:diaminopimelate epimerase